MANSIDPDQTARFTLFAHAIFFFFFQKPCVQNFKTFTALHDIITVLENYFRYSKFGCIKLCNIFFCFVA